MRHSQTQRNKIATALSIILIAVSAQTKAETAEEKGFAIAARSDRSDRGFADSRVKMNMVLRNAAGREATRTLVLNTLEVPDEQVGDNSIIIFDSPADIDGTALLSHAKILDADNQWLYLPALKRVKRISSVNKSGPLVGSEFAFEGFTALELNKYSYRYTKSKSYGELTCDVVERKPRYEHSGYSRQLAWIDQKDYLVRKVDFFDRRGDLLKTLAQKEWKQYDGKYWRSHLLSMPNHQTRKSTDLRFSDYAFKTGQRDRDFSKSILKRLR